MFVRQKDRTVSLLSARLVWAARAAGRAAVRDLRRAVQPALLPAGGPDHGGRSGRARRDHAPRPRPRQVILCCKCFMPTKFTSLMTSRLTGRELSCEVQIAGRNCASTLLLHFPSHAGLRAEAARVLKTGSAQLLHLHPGSQRTRGGRCSRRRRRPPSGTWLPSAASSQVLRPQMV